MNSELLELTQKLFGSSQKVSKLDKLFGEASYRVYYRVSTEAGKTYILMQLPPGKSSVSEEITNYQGPQDQLPFLNIAQYLHKYQLPAPQVIQSDLGNGLILLQDLGGKSFEKLVKESNESMTLFFYKQAIDLLLQLQQTGEKHRDQDCIAFHRSFDRTLLLWEFEHFLEWGIEDRFELKIPEAERKEMMGFGNQLVDEIIKIPLTLTHRDFQSRNLMLWEYQFYMIDFQDALQGPIPYDLVALLRDSYIALPEATAEQLIDYYLEGRKKVGLPVLQKELFIKDFYRVTLQRKLKDSGRFQFILKKKNNPNFLPYVPTSLSYVYHAFSMLPEYQELHLLFEKYVPELKTGG